MHENIYRQGTPDTETVYPSEFPAIHAPVYETERGTLYLREPGVALISAPAVNLSGMKEFLEGYPSEYKFTDYLDDTGNLPPGEQLAKVAGQACYASFGPKRSMNSDIDRYLSNIITSGHGSVLEHANYSVLLYGLSRSCTHELVRHRAGVGFSQLSQRYVSGNVLRFVERMEYQFDPQLHQKFEERIDRAKAEYEEMSEELLIKQNEGYATLDAEQKTDRRKRVQQVSRSLLPNETETVMVMTGNIRAWRHIFNMRASEHAETEIRKAMFNTYKIIQQVAPVFFNDFEEKQLPDGTWVISTPNPKV